MTASPNPPSPKSLLAHFERLPDPRVNRTREHDLMDVLVIAVCTLLCGGEPFNDMADFGHAKQDWFKTFLSLRNGIPSPDTFNCVFAALDPGEFLDCFLKWTQSLRRAVPQEMVALDGKALRRALGKDQSVQYIVSAWAEGNGLALGQLKVADKSNEITAVPGAGTGRVHCDARCHGLPKEDRQGDQGSRCRLRSGIEGQPGKSS